MSEPGKDDKGRFLPGHKYTTGRPKRKYSITSALATAADLPQSTDDDGNPLTDAQLAARWLWKIVRTGLDTRTDPDDPDNTVSTTVGMRDRLEALRTILAQTEPTKELAERMAKADEEELQEMAAKFGGLTEVQLEALSVIGLVKT